MFSPQSMRIISALVPVLDKTQWWDRRLDVAWYVSRCVAAGFCNTEDMMRLCARRYMEGKRKITPPGTKRKKNAQKERRRLAKSVPVELASAIAEVAGSDLARQYAGGNHRALNAMVGKVLKASKADPEFVRNQIIAMIEGQK